MATLDKLRDDIDRSGGVAILDQGSDGVSYLEKSEGRYAGEVAGEDIHGRNFDQVLNKLRVKESKTYDAGWSARWQLITQKEAMARIKRPLSWFQKVTGLTNYNLCREANVEGDLLRHVEQGGPIAPAPAKRICAVLSEELGQPVTPGQIKWMVLN